uniref:Uncharacterized protein n=1 Tax=Caenorhabditis japonica TaxID=281687 RepID=A0A8R1ED08_CAEJA
MVSRNTLFFALLVTLVLLMVKVESKPVIKSGYSKNHQLFRPKPDDNNSENDSQSDTPSETFWSNVYFVITASDSFFGG